MPAMSRFAPTIGAGFAVLASLLALGGCGRDEPEQGATPVPTPAATTPAATTPEAVAETSPESTTPAERESAEPTESGDDQPAAAAGADGDAVVKRDASAKTKNPKTTVGRTAAALRDAGFSVQPFGATGNATASLKIGDASIAFYANERDAKEDYLTFSGAFENSAAAYGDVILKGTRVYLLSKPTALRAADKAELRKIVKVGESAR